MHHQQPTPPNSVRPILLDSVADEARIRSQRGLTVIELLIVMVIIAIVAAISIVSVAGVLDHSRQRATVADMRAIAKAIESYAVDYNDPPSDTDPFPTMIAELTPYYSSALPVTDHWGYTYKYSRDAAGNYTLQSLGKDGIDGDDITQETEDDYDRDIVVSNGIFVATPN